MVATRRSLFPILLSIMFIDISFCQKDAAVNFLKVYNSEIGELSYAAGDASFTKATNITDYNSQIYEKLSLALSKTYKEIRANASKINITDADLDTKRQFKLLLMTMQSQNESVVKQASSINDAMETIYSTGRVRYDKLKLPSLTVEPGTTELSLDKHIVPLMAKSRNADELAYVWKGWRDAVGPKIKDKYTAYVKVKNIGARENGYKDAGDYKRKIYEVDNLQEIAEGFWNELKPVYEEVHAYVRHRLRQQYSELIKEDAPIPAHLLGNMWAQSWENIFDIVAPYKDEPTLDITPEFARQNYTVRKMFEKAEEFFTSIGWMKLPDSFWKKSLFVEPDDGRKVVCHASAWDFSVKRDGSEDVRVKMCTLINQDNFITIHHELGHIYYYLLYWNQSAEYRTGANPGFHEAVGDTLVLSIQTPDHLKQIGLLDKVSNNTRSDINFLLKTAMERIAFLPFGYLMDQWMWGVYSGDIQPEDYNKKWWEMRLKYQGLTPPVERNSENDFDPGAKYHIPADTPYIRYFFAHILQFTFHKTACKIANNTGPLHKCSIYNSKKAGEALGDMLKLGKQKPWQEALKQFTGSDKLSADPIKEYFDPLITWLKKEREEKKYKLGWTTRKSKDNSGNPLFVSFFSIIFCFSLTNFLHFYVYFY